MIFGHIEFDCANEVSKKYDSCYFEDENIKYGSKQMKNTFILGAGVSALSIPLVSNWKSFSQKWINLLDKALILDDTHISSDIEKKAFLKVARESNDFPTPDTYAKTLWLTKQEENYRYLKLFYESLIYSITRYPEQYLELIFEENNPMMYDQSFIELFKVNLDNRILSFITEIADSAEENRVYTWNYDDLPEVTADYINKLSKEKAQYKIGLYHLNGQIRKEFVSMSGELRETVRSNKRSIGRERVSRIKFHSKEKQKMKFSWEQDSIKNLLPQERGGAQNLIISGYSMPYYNRQVDTKIIQHFINQRGKKIFIQNPNPEPIEDILRSTFQFSKKESIHAIQIIPVRSTNRIFIP